MYSKKYLIDYELEGGSPKQPQQPLPFFDPNNKLSTTASYIYSRDPSDHKFYFVFCRKVLPNRRIMKDGSIKGAAGTNEQYHGKWGSFGGSSSRSSRHTLAAAIDEINDEADLNFKHNLDVNIDRSKNLTQYLNLKVYRNKNGVGIFIFFLPDFNLFTRLFPKYPSARKGPDLVTSSHGEIDTVSSFNMDDIRQKQAMEYSLNANNYFLSYNLNTFNDIVIPYISSVSDAFKKNNLSKPIRAIKDIKPRDKPEDRNYYKEIQDGKERKYEYF
tara:strand:+ start:251 stop:1066 length:816 start_codon:yes stop_codon:yes gene_type:complete